MEASSLRHATRPAPLTGGVALLRLKGDEQLVALVRRGHAGAFEVLFRRYQPRLLAFCRHMLGSSEDAEDVLQEAFVSAHRAILADDRPIAARAWLYRIARNRCLDHLRRPRGADGHDSMDVFERDGGVSTADIAHRRAEIRQLMGDIRDLPEAQRSALLLREVDSLSHDQIAAAMETTVASVKSLLVRARISLAEAARARSLTCDEIHLSLAEVAEGIATSRPEVRRHLKACAPCQAFKRDLRRTSRGLAAVYPLGPLLLLKDLLLGAKPGLGFLGGGAAAGAPAAAGAATTTAAALAAKAAGGGLAAKTAAGLAVAALATGGAVELERRAGVAPGPERTSSAARAPSHQRPSRTDTDVALAGDRLAAADASRAPVRRLVEPPRRSSVSPRRSAGGRDPSARRAQPASRAGARDASSRRARRPSARRARPAPALAAPVERRTRARDRAGARLRAIRADRAT